MPWLAARAKATLFLPAADAVMSAETAGGFEVAQQARTTLFACGQRSNVR